MSGPHLGRSKLILVALCSQFQPPLGVGAGAAEGVEGYFMNIIKMELTGQGLCGGTGWTIQGVSESA